MEREVPIIINEQRKGYKYAWEITFQNSRIYDRWRTGKLSPDLTVTLTAVQDGMNREYHFETLEDKIAWEKKELQPFRPATPDT